MAAGFIALAAARARGTGEPTVNDICKIVTRFPSEKLHK
jgi:hypothetical protein